MAIKRVTFNTLSYLVAEIKSRYATKEQLSALAQDVNALVSYAKTSDVTAAINSAVAGLIKLTSLSVAESGNGNVVTQLVYDKTTGKFTVKKGLTALQESDFVEITAAEITTLFS